jgi:hypothetical protein
MRQRPNDPSGDNQRNDDDDEDVEPATEKEDRANKDEQADSESKKGEDDPEKKPKVNRVIPLPRLYTSILHLTPSFIFYYPSMKMLQSSTMLSPTSITREEAIFNLLLI